MSEEENEESHASKWTILLVTAGVTTVIIGIIIIFLGTFLDEAGSASAVIVAFVGPIPIVFAAGSNSVLLVLIGIIVAVTSAVLWLVLKRKIS